MESNLLISTMPESARETYSKFYELDCTRCKAQTCQAGKEQNEPHAVSVELEAHGFREEHAPNQAPFGSIEPGPDDQTQCLWLGAIPANPNDFRRSVQE